METTTKHCHACNQTKPVEQFSKDRTTWDGQATQCKACRVRYRKDNVAMVPAHRKRWAQANPEKGKAYNKKWRDANPDKIKNKQLRHDFGITLIDYNRMSDKAGFSCEICKGGIEDPTTGRRETLAVDHCHKQDKIRGILCRHCNTALGLMRDDPTILRAAMQYLLDRG